MHTGGSTAEELEKEFLKVWFDTLSNGKADFFCATTDTAANMNSFGIKMEAQKVHHIYCADHIFHLTAKQAFKLNKGSTIGKEVALSLEKAIAHVTHFNKSSQALEEKLKKHQSDKKQPNGIVTDVVTRWWSTLDMLQRLLQIWTIISIMRAEGELKDLSAITDADWENVRHVILVVELFNYAMKMVEGNRYYVTVSLVPTAVQFIREKLCNMASDDKPDSASKQSAKVLLDDFEKRWFVGDRSSLFGGSVHRGGGNRQIWN